MARRAPVLWTPKMLASLRHMWRIEGLPVAEIAVRLGVPYHAVSYQADQLHLCLHPLNCGRLFRDNLRVPRTVWGGRDFDFWRQSDIEVSRA